MGEKEELTKQDLSAVPLLIILSPPPNFLPEPGQPAMPWQRWLKAFENYTEQVGEGKLVDSTKFHLLLNSLGQEGQQILSTLMPGETSYTDTISVLTNFFTADQDSQMHILNFHQRAQMTGENGSQFICALDDLLKLCNYQEPHDHLILKQLVQKTNNPRLRDRLLSETQPLSIEKALHICEEVESLVQEVNVYIADDVEQQPVKRKRGRPKYGDARAKKPSAATKLSKRTSSRLKDEYYYGNDQLYYSDESDSGAKDRCRSNELNEIAGQKEIKTEALSPQGPEDKSSDDLASTKPKGPSCPICVNRHFRGLNKLLRHMRTHTQEKPFTCPICDLAFSQTYHMTRHMRNQHGAGQHVCPTCGITLSSATELQSHKKTHPAPAMPCPYCGEKCSSPRAFANHVKTHGQSGEEMDDETSFLKDLVDKPLRRKRGRPKRSSTKQATEVSTNTATEDDTNVNLPGSAANLDIGLADENNDLLDKISQLSEIISHEEYVERMLAEIKTEDSDIESPDLIQTDLSRPHCRICLDKTFRNLNRLLRHMQTHSSLKPFTCYLCGDTFSQSYHMVRHMRNKHDAGLYVCPTCGMDLGSDAEVQAHKMTHPPQPVPCPYCDKISINYHKFLGHIKLHGKLTTPKEQAVKSSRKISSNESEDSDCKSNKGEFLEGLVDQDVSVGVGGDVEGTVQTEESVAPRVQKAKRGRPRRTEIRDETKASIQPEQQSSSTVRNDDDYYGNANIYSGIDSDSIERETDEKGEAAEESSTEQAQLSNSDFGDMKEELGEHSDDADSQEAAESDLESSSESDDTSDSDWQSKTKLKTFQKSKVSVKQVKSKSEDNEQDKSANVKGHFCPYCEGRRFRGADKLARHMRMHTKEKPFKCPVCDKAFSQSYHMTRHQRMQHGQGQYICSLCGLNLQSWMDLKAHKKLHVPGTLACPFCDKQFKYKSSYMVHIKGHTSTPGGPQGCKCSDCGKVFKRRYHLKRHLAHHRKATNGEFYTCPTCQKIFAFEADLRKHLEKHEMESKGICSSCKKVFSGPEELMVHVEEVHKKTYPCQTCGKIFKLEHALKSHEAGHVNGQFYCGHCCKYFQKQSHYKRHMLVHRRKESRCPHCDTVFIKMNAFKYHLRSHINERPYQCSCCIECFEHKEDYDQHCLKHKKLKKERPYSCTRCDWAFVSLMELTEHMNTHEGEQPANCSICGRTFLNKNKLEKHMSIHSGERPHLCSICGNGFSCAASLKLHMNVHTGVKPFHCAQCTKSFSTASSLRLHSRQHMAVRPSFECPECGRTYGRMTELKMHQRYHTGDKPYACSCCSKRFISRDKLNVHMRIHTGERPYSCPHCGQTFSQAGDRNRHMKKYH